MKTAIEEGDYSVNPRSAYQRKHSTCLLSVKSAYDSIERKVVLYHLVLNTSCS